jgi:hypothetical protein
MSSKKRNYTTAMGYNNDYETVQEEEKKKLSLSHEINQRIHSTIPFTKKDLQSEEGIQNMLRWFETYNQNIINQYNIPFTETEL